MRIPTSIARNDVGFNMTPMIDVVFLLIIFFLVSSHLARQESRLQLPLPAAESGEQMQYDPAPRVTVNVVRDGQILLAGRRLETRELQQRLENERSRSGQELEIRIRADRNVPYQYVGPVLAAVARGCLARRFRRRPITGFALMRCPSCFTSQRDTLGVRMTPMIDVVFLLLVFFVWTASFQAVEYSLPTNLLSPPGAGSVTEVDPELVDFDRIVVRLQWSNARPAWTINERIVSSLEEVRQTLATIAAIKSDIPVVLDAVPEVPLGHVIDVYDIARQEGFGRVQFAVMEGSGSTQK